MEDDRRSRFPPALIAAAVLVLPVLYILAVGPIGWLLDNGYIDSNSRLRSALQAIDAPLAYCSELCPPFKLFLDWYLQTCWGS